MTVHSSRRALSSSSAKTVPDQRTTSSRAALTLALRELTYGYRMKIDPRSRPIRLEPALTTQADIAATFITLLAHEAVEVFGIPNQATTILN